MNKRPFFLLLVLWLALRAAASAYYDPHTQSFLSRDPIREHGGINLYAYCGNDPVGNYDPIGLMTAEEYKAFVEAARQRNGTAGEFFASFWYLPGLFNPFGHGSPLSLKRRGLHEGTGLAVQGIDSSPVPWPMKAVAKFGLGVGIAGDSLNPLNSAADLSETAIQIKDRGIVDVATTTVQGMGRTIVEQPAMASGIFMVGAASFNGARAMTLRRPPTIGEIVTRYHYAPSASITSILDSGVLTATDTSAPLAGIPKAWLTPITPQQMSGPLGPFQRLRLGFSPTTRIPTPHLIDGQLLWRIEDSFIELRVPADQLQKAPWWKAPLGGQEFLPHDVPIPPDSITGGLQ